VFGTLAVHYQCPGLLNGRSRCVGNRAGGLILCDDSMIANVIADAHSVIAVVAADHCVFDAWLEPNAAGLVADVPLILGIARLSLFRVSVEGAVLDLEVAGAGHNGIVRRGVIVGEITICKRGE